MSDTPRIAVDRIEGDVAVLDIGGQAVEVPAAVLPEGAQEGSVLSFALDEAAAEDAKDAAEARLERLRRRSPKPSGPIEL